MATSNVCNCTRNIIQFSAVYSNLSLSLMLLLVTLASAHLDNPIDFLSRSCGPKGIKNGSAWEGNLKMVLNRLVENVNKTGYNISSHGQNGESEVYGLAQCRGDLNASACRACVSSATKSIGENCSGSISKSIYLSGCFLRYATHNFYSQVNLSDASSVFRCDDTKLVNGTDENARGVDSQIDNLLTRVVGMAVSSNVSYSTLSEEGFYTMAQCWRDLTMDQCNQCLNSLYKNLSRCPAGTSEGEALNDNCVTRYDKDKFYGDGIPLLSPPSTGQSRATDQGKDRPKMVGLSIGGAVLVVMLVGVVVIWKRRLCFSKQRPGYYNASSELSTAISKSKLNYKFHTLQIATQNFNPTNKIGQGGFGSVYKGVIRNGGEIAIKKLFSNREESVSDFFNEVNLISRVQHRNLVKLLGCSVDGPDKLLVYEYLPNRSLDHFLFDKNKGNILDWQRRFDIILGTASGLAYLHQESNIRIIHRDIKASNVLLDHNFKPKIADFGLVRYFDEDQTHLSTGIVGTRGYMAPEYLVHGHLTEKVDVYAFGVLVLEIISGRKNKTPTHANDTPSLLTMAWKCHVSNNLSSLIDPNIQGNYQEVLQVFHIALLCTQASATLRPSMSAVIMFLTNEGTNILEVSQPPFIDTIHLESNINTSVAPNHSKSNNSIALNHLPSNTSMSISPTLETHNPSSNISSSSAPATSMSFGTISTSPFGPR